MSISSTPVTDIMLKFLYPARYTEHSVRSTRVNARSNLSPVFIKQLLAEKQFD